MKLWDGRTVVTPAKEGTDHCKPLLWTLLSGDIYFYILTLNLYLTLAAFLALISGFLPPPHPISINFKETPPFGLSKGGIGFILVLKNLDGSIFSSYLSGVSY
jgi:hypothetical protein